MKMTIKEDWLLLVGVILVTIGLIGGTTTSAIDYELGIAYAEEEQTPQFTYDVCERCLANIFGLDEVPENPSYKIIRENGTCKAKLSRASYTCIPQWYEQAEEQMYG